MENGTLLLQTCKAGGQLKGQTEWNRSKQSMDWQTAPGLHHTLRRGGLGGDQRLKNGWSPRWVRQMDPGLRLDWKFKKGTRKNSKDSVVFMYGTGMASAGAGRLVWHPLSRREAKVSRLYGIVLSRNQSSFSQVACSSAASEVGLALRYKESTDMGLRSTKGHGCLGGYPGTGRVRRGTPRDTFNTAHYAHIFDITADCH